MPCLALSPHPPHAVGGVLDLRSTDFRKIGSVELSGEWDFFPGLLLTGASCEAFPSQRRLRSVPDLWKGNEMGFVSGQGAGTYRLRVLLPEDAPPLALAYTTVSTSFEAEANGRLVAAAGRPGAFREGSVPAYRPGVAALGATGREILLVVRVSNHEYREGGMWRAFTLGSLSVLDEARRRADILVYVQAAAIVAMALNSLFLYLFRRQEKAFLFFCLFGFSLVLRVLVTGNYLLVRLAPGISFDLLIRLEYASVALPVPLCTLFFAALYPDESKRTLVIVACVPFALRLAFGVTLVPLPLLTRSIYLFYPLAAAAVALVFFGILLPALVKRRQGAIAFFLGGLILLAAFVNDSLYSAFVVRTGNFLGYALLAFIVIQAGVLAERFTAAFERSEALQEELALSNEKLEIENERYRVTQDQLEKALAEKDLLIREVHHRVKNSLQIVSSSLGLQAHRTSDPAALEVYSTARNRIRAISLVHEKLYGLESGEELDFGNYARDLCRQLAEGYGARLAEGGIKVVAGRVAVSVDDCVDLGLMLTELVANACKHGVAEGRGVSIELHISAQAGRIRIAVVDDGPGFPPGFDPEGTKGLGFRVIMSLATKHNGIVRILPGPGARVELDLALSSASTGDGGKQA